MQAVAMVYEDNNMETTDAFNNHGSGVAGGGINISRLKSMFQTDSDKENRGRSRRGGRGGGGDDGRSGVYSSMTNVQRSPDSKRKRPDTLEMNKNHANMYKSRSVSVDRVVGNNTNSIDIPEPTDVDTQKLYETTNHVQRFHFTRAIFAKMEEESKRKTPDGSSRNNSRSVSPGGGRAVSHSPMRSPINVSSSSHESSTADSSPHKPHSTSEPVRHAVVNKFGSEFGIHVTPPTSPTGHNDTGPGKQHQQQQPQQQPQQRTSSYDDNHLHHHPPASHQDRKYTGSGTGSYANKVHQSDALKSRSDSDMFTESSSHLHHHSDGGGGDEDYDDEDITSRSPKTLIQKFESKKGSNSAPAAGDGGVGSTTQSTKSSANPSPWHSNSRSNNKAVHTSTTVSGKKVEKKDSSPSYGSKSITGGSSSNSNTTKNRSLNNSSNLPSHQFIGSNKTGPSTVGYRSEVSSNKTSDHTKPAAKLNTSLGSSIGSNTSSSKQNEMRSDYLNKFQSDQSEDADAIARSDSMLSWRLRRQQRDKEKEDEESSGAVLDTSVSSVSTTGSLGSSTMNGSITGGGVLLPKRRSRDESQIFKDEIEAKLQETESYWQSVHKPSNRILTDSMNSSGSGEEMARSDSNHEFQLESPTSPTGAETGGVNSWAAKYSIGGGGERRYSGSNSDNTVSAPTTPGSVGIPRVDTFEKALIDEEKKSVHGSSTSSWHGGGGTILENSKVTNQIPAYNSSTNQLPSYNSSSSTPPTSPGYYGSSSSTTMPLYKPKQPAVAAIIGINSNNAGNMDPNFMDTLGMESEILLNEGEEADYVEIERVPVSPRVSNEPGIVKEPPPFPQAAAASNIGSTSDDLTPEGGTDTLTDEGDFLEDKREDGDGTEEPGQPEPRIPSVDDFSEDFFTDIYNPLWDKYSRDIYDGSDMVNQIWDQYFDYSQYQKPRLEPVDGEIEVYEDGNFTYEVIGLPDGDPDDEFYPNAKPPSRIKFSSGPIRVYSTYSVDEYDRKNEDVDPMAASAEYELEKRVERMHQFEVDLIKGNDGLGLSIIGMGVGADAGLEKLGIFIKTLTDGGAAQKDGRIEVNDQIIEVDGKSLVGVTQAYAASVLRNTSGKVRYIAH